MKAFKSYKVIKNDVINLKRLKYVMEIFDKYIDNNNSIVGINLPWQT